MPQILVVDDDPLIGDYIVTLLARNGLTADLADTARDALDRVAAGSYDAVVTDVMMPDMDGIEFLRAVRLVRAEIPVIAVTGAADPQYRQAVMRAMRAFGASLVLPKPIDPEQFLHGVRRLCAARGAVTEPVRS